MQEWPTAFLLSGPHAMRAPLRAGDDYRDERVRAAFVMAPALAQAFDRGSLARIVIPVSMLVGDNDDQAPAKTNAAWMAAQMQHAKLREIRNGTHYMFIAQCTPSGQAQQRQICTDPSGLSRAQVHRDTVAQAVAFSVAFFDAALSP
ncbi:alpha/beta hydrolase family protein [Verminephrobacter eiseniae]|uniref:Putative lipoprotein signal peptide n=3 Tax=Verminephrobacter eiseniae TaxID=364317 RepID=A1WEV4_VEREI|nr:putative lipoprotein signal peptide [Verminephrobacter eiseniae]ABM56161.1 putative lipoprotein signal peptide [Verminephrobacter eiseniae EF01-2]MCW5286531.1 hypothetical protein [Verminephrobacter eiseniae]MCW8191064.1 hypothetical protein [Verminephrobacter eiseniae]